MIQELERESFNSRTLRKIKESFKSYNASLKQVLQNLIEINIIKNLWGNFFKSSEFNDRHNEKSFLISRELINIMIKL